MSNYFNSLNESEKKSQLSKCRFMNIDEFQNENNILKEKNIVIVGCGAQGLNQGLNMRDSGLNISITRTLAGALQNWSCYTGIHYQKIPGTR